jgi:spore coat protein U-like protein
MQKNNRLKLRACNFFAFICPVLLRKYYDFRESNPWGHDFMKIKYIALMLVLIAGSYVHASCIGIGCTCGISNTPAVSFGSYSTVSSTPLSGSGTISVTCSALVAGLNVSYVIALNAGTNGTFAARQMIQSSTLLSYNLYTTSGLTAIWGDGTSGTSTVSDSYVLNLLSTTRNYTVYGSIPASQNVPVGTYLDTVTVTVTY